MEFWSSDRRFGLQLPPEELEKILHECKGSADHETGGILVGYYTEAHDSARVTVVTTAPTDSKKGRTWLLRGTRGLTSVLKELWLKKREYYLGEWHFHPYASPTPSSTDIAQMHEIAISSSYACPEPTMLIIGGDPSGLWNARAFVFPKGEMIEMQEEKSLTGSQ